MLQEFQSQIATLNYFWLVGAVLFGFFAGRIFTRGTILFAIGGYVAFVVPTMMFGDFVRSIGYASAFTGVANGWGITSFDLASACVAGLPRQDKTRDGYQPSPEAARRKPRSSSA